MPHIAVKMWKGRTPEEQKAAALAVRKALSESLNVKEDYISVSVEDYTKEQWDKVDEDEIAGNKHTLIMPNYDA